MPSSWQSTFLRYVNTDNDGWPNRCSLVGGVLLLASALGAPPPTIAARGYGVGTE